MAKKITKDTSSPKDTKETQAKDALTPAAKPSSATTKAKAGTKTVKKLANGNADEVDVAEKKKPTAVRASKASAKAGSKQLESPKAAKIEVEAAMPYHDNVELGYIEVFGARSHNLKNIDVRIPRNKLVVLTGLSGSGKSSLAFDTLYAEGQRRYMETFSAYARQFLGSMQRPEVDKITGLSPVISIEQKTVSKNPRSTVGTITEVYDFLRLLFARGSTAISSATGKPMVRFTDEQILQSVLQQFSGQAVMILAPLVKRRKGHYRELFESLLKSGYTRARVDGEIIDIVPKLQLPRYKVHDIELLIDRVTIHEEAATRVRSSLNLALQKGKGTCSIVEMPAKGEGQERYYSRSLMCLDTGISYDEPQPNTFSFNTPYGWCERCKGLGQSYSFERDVIIPDPNISIQKGGIAPLGDEMDAWALGICRAILKKHKLKITDPIAKFSEEALQELLYGNDERLYVEIYGGEYPIDNKGLIGYFEEALMTQTGKGDLRERLYEYGHLSECNVCNGARLKTETRYFQIGGEHIGTLANMQLSKLHEFLTEQQKKQTDREALIGNEIYKEILSRVAFLLNVGLGYLSLHRPAYSLSGGEAQRIRLATQIGSKLINVTYILDEPSIGLHQRDNERLIYALKDLRDTGNSVLVVEHDKDIMMESDYIIDMGPAAGVHGGQIVAHGTPAEFIQQGSLTAQFLRGEQNIHIPDKRREGNGKSLKLSGATGHNLKNVTLKLPLGTLICVTGVSGGGKSSLIAETLYPIMRKHYFRAGGAALPYKKIEGLEHLDKVIEIDQSPIGRTPRSNPATYTQLFTHIRNLFAMLPEAKIRGYQPGRFSFNVKGGRCDECGGGGVKVIEMNFLPDVHVQCPSCMGRRYNRETLEVRYKGKSINDVLNMTVDTAVDFFESIPQILRKVQTLAEVGLGYITLGQSSTTLSGGEAQRVKLAEQLSKRDTGRTFYILDEPTTGLHFRDIQLLMDQLQKLVDRGNTVLIIEHNLDVIKLADHVVDLGPEGGDAGGTIVAQGTPELVAKSKTSITAQFLRKELGMN